MAEPRHVGFLFSAPMVLAVLAGEKTQTRRIIKAPKCCFVNGRQPIWERAFANRGIPIMAEHHKNEHLKLCYGGGDHPEPVYTRVYPAAQPGDLIWGRETLRADEKSGRFWRYGADRKIIQFADGERVRAMHEWVKTREREHCVAIHMPKFASRLWLEVTEVRAQRVRDITEADALAEGVKPVVNPFRQTEVIGTARMGFELLWKSINGEVSWAQNDWVFAYTFKRVDPPALTTGEKKP